MYDVVVQAAGLTVLAFSSITGYAFVTKKDFSFMRGFVTTGLFVVLGGSILSIFVQSSALSFAVSAGGVLLFSGFILYDTSNIIHHHKEDEWVGAAMSMYLNVLNLFLFLLRLLSNRD
jgi:FtsH-binding integral membrane protein